MSESTGSFHSESWGSNVRVQNREVYHWTPSIAWFGNYKEMGVKPWGCRISHYFHSLFLHQRYHFFSQGFGSDGIFG
jgi:hypothetical protein